MNEMKRVLSAGIFLLMAIGLTACGGGGGSGGGATGAAVSKGVITAKGSIFVNGIEYGTTGAAVRIDDNPGSETDLKVGMIVKVRGASDDATKKGTATVIEARDALEGTIDNNGVDPVNGTITVMGQTVKIEDNVTRLNDDDNVKTFAAANFQVGDRVEVHAFPDDQGGLRATRVAKKVSGEFEIKGFVKSTAPGTFVLSLTPGGADALAVTGLLPAGAVVGSLVEVKSAAAPVAGAITATSITLEDRLGAAGEKVEAEGIVSSGDVSSFVINGQRVVTNASTLFEGGLKADFAVGTKVEAEGPLDASGAIVASKISFRSNIKIEANASNVTASGLSVLGLNVAVNSFTRIDNGPVTGGSHVEVRATPDRDGNLIATRIVVLNADTKAFLQGPVTAAAAPGLTILGITATTNASTQFRISTDSTDQAVTSATFFASLKPNVTVVKLRWNNFSATTVAVDEAEIQLGK